MTLQDSSTVSGVGPRVAALVVALFVVDLGWNLSLNTLLDRTGLATTAGVAYDVTFPLTTLGAVGGLLVATVAGAVLIAALVRAFAPESDALGADETPVETLVVYARTVVVAVGGAVAVAVGLVALVVPGVLVLVHLPLVFVAVAADGDPIGRAVDRTRTRVRGHRARIVAVVLAVLAVPFSVATVATLTALLPSAVELALGAVVTTIAIAAGAAAFTAIAASIEGTQPGTTQTDRVNPSTSRQL